MLKLALTVAAVCIFLAIADVPQPEENLANIDPKINVIVKRDANSAKKKSEKKAARQGKKKKGNGKKKTKGKIRNGKKGKRPKRRNKKKKSLGKNGKKGRRTNKKNGRNGKKKKNCKTKKCRQKTRQRKTKKGNGVKRGGKKKEKKGKKPNRGTRRRKTKKCDKKCRKERRRQRKIRNNQKEKCKDKKEGQCNNGCEWRNGECKKSNKKRKSGRQTSTLPSCFSKMFKYASKYKKAGNIFRQVKRTEGNKDKIEKKAAKKGDFNSTLMTLTSALGGNKTAPKCAGNETASRQFADTLSLLDKCEADVEAACKFPSNVTIQTACKEAGEKFLNDIDACLKPSLSDDDACTCFDGLDLDATLTTIDGCSTKGDNDAVLAEKNKCKKAFSDCKKAEDQSVSLVDTCKEQLKCGGVSSKEEGEKALKILNPLSDALKQTGFADALNRLGLTEGAGSDGKLPNATSGLRLRRQAEDAKCVGVLDQWKAFNKSGDAALPDGVSGDVVESETDNTVKILNDLNQDTDLDSKLASCQKETGTRQVVVLAIVEIRFYVFWCGWFQVTIVEIKITIISVAIGVPPPPPITQAPSPPAVSTSSPGRNLKKLVKKLLN